MKRVFFVGLAVVAALPLAVGQTGRQKMDRSTSVEQEIAKMEREFGEALTYRDAAALARLMADDFIAINSLAVEMTKAQVLEASTSPDYELQFMRNEDIGIRVFGDCAVATARGTAKGRYKGQDASGQFRYTRVWLRRNGRWQAIAAQSTNIPGS